MVPDEKNGRLVGCILQNVFLLGDLDKEAGAFTVGDPFFDVMGRQQALKMTKGVIAEGVIMVAHNGGVGLSQD